MQKELPLVKEFAKQNKWQSIWRRAVRVMACVVVFCTTYALILPAITMEQPLCELEEHVHSDGCYVKQTTQMITRLECSYETLGIHRHTEECYDADQELICGCADFVVHEHNEACFDGNGVLVCELAEIKAHEHGDECYQVAEQEMHVHDDTCYTVKLGELICGLEETEGHAHTAECMTRGDLVCTLEETEGHAHGENCSETVLVCELTDPSHVHEDACYQTNSLCDIPETAGHAHSDDCYGVNLTCDRTEEEAHFHTDVCYGQIRELTCQTEGVNPEDIPEPELICEITVVEEHVHTDSCFVTEEVPLENVDTLTCGQEEGETHTHTDRCYGTWELVCGKEEHTHSEECMHEPEVSRSCGMEAHRHSEECLDEEGNLNCALVEHTHDVGCYADLTADVEDAAIWEATLPGNRTGIHAEDLLTVARSQLGYAESTKNYIVESGEIRGYTRYGAWHGDPYGDWSAMFVAFCLHYAGVDKMPVSAASQNWIALLKSAGLYAPAADCVPEAGDIVFFVGNDGKDHVGIVSGYFPAEDQTAAQIQCIEGDSGNAVCITTYSQTDPTILGYGQLPSQSVESPADGDSAEEGYYDYMAVANIVDPEVKETSTYSLMRSSGVMMASARNTVTGTKDMTSMIQSVTMYRKQNGGWVEVPNGGTVTQGEDLKFTIDYVVGGKVLVNGVNTLVYEIPSSIKNVESHAGVVHNKQNEEVGTFTVTTDANGKSFITITFYDEYVTNNADFNKAIEGSISIYGTVMEITDGSDDESDVIFSDKVQIDMEVKEPEAVKGDIAVKKEKVSVEGGKIIFKITVTSNAGTYSEVILTDEMTGGLAYKEGLTANEYFDITDKNGQRVEYVLSDDSVPTNFTITLPQMEPQEQYTITYVATAVDSHVLAENKVTVNSTNNYGFDINSSAKVDHTFKYVDKTGEAIGVDPETGKSIIQWTIVINEEKADISGWTLLDIMQDTNGTQSSFTGPVTITDSKGKTYKDIKLPLKFPAGSKDTYTVTYTTMHDLVSGDNVVGNWAGLQYDDKGNDIGDTEWVGIGTNNPLSKEGRVLGVDPETGKILIQWTITLDTTNGPMSAKSYIHDAMYDGQYMTYEQLQAMFAAAEEAAGVSIGTKLAIVAGRYEERWNDEIDDSNIYNHFYIQFTEDIPKGKRISFSFTVTADSISDSGSFYNQVFVNDTVYADGYAKYEFNKPTVTKRGVDVNDDYRLVDGELVLNFDELSELNGEKTLWWRLRLQIPEGVYNEPIILIDTLPEGLELVGTIARIWGSAGEQQIMYPDETGYSRVSWYGNDNWEGYGVQLQTSIGADGRQIVTYTVEDNTAALLAENGSLIDLYLACKFRDDFQWADPDAVITQVPFTNTVTAQSPDGEPFSTDEHTFVVRYDNSDEVVSKLGKMTTLNELEYQVVLNEKGRNLDPDNSTIKVQDVLTYVSPADYPLKLYLKAKSVNVYDYTDGVKGELIATAKYTYTATSSGEGDIIYTHTLDLVLPDAQAMLLEYVYTVEGKPNDNATYDMINTCTITGIADGSISDDKQINIKVYESMADADYSGIYIYKVNAENNKLYLPGAVFYLYTWDGPNQKYVPVKNPYAGSDSNVDPYAFITNEEGLLALATENKETPIIEPIAYNTAYYIEEITPPDGYFKNPDPYYFYVYDDKHPMNLPTGFQGDKLTNGALIYYVNEPNTTELVIHKKWQDHNGNPVTVKADQVASIRFELWQKMGDAETLYGTYTVTPDRNGFWEKVITGLPKGIPNPDDGTKGTLYTYYIKEVSVPNYQVHYEYVDGNGVTVSPSGGINSGTINMTNREQEGYELPETGGTGNQMYTMAGLLLMLISAAYLMYSTYFRRREEL